MSTIITDILIALARAALATFLARELYAFTVPSSLAFTLALYLIITRDPIRESLPQWIGAKGILALIWGKRNVRQDREVVRFSIFGRDVFWVTEEVLGELLLQKSLIQIFHRNGVFMEYGEKERVVVDRVKESFVQ